MTKFATIFRKHGKIWIFSFEQGRKPIFDIFGKKWQKRKHFSQKWTSFGKFCPKIGKQAGITMVRQTTLIYKGMQGYVRLNLNIDKRVKYEEPVLCGLLTPNCFLKENGQNTNLIQKM